MPSNEFRRLHPTQTGHDRLGLFNYLVGAGEGRRRDSQAERPRGFGVDDEFECGRLLNRKISRLSSLQDAVDIASGAAAMSGAFDARNGSLSTMSASGMACVIAAVNAGEKMHRRAGVKMHCGRMGGRPRMRGTGSSSVTAKSALQFDQ
jgi:hypothetical protein